MECGPIFTISFFALYGFGILCIAWVALVFFSGFSGFKDSSDKDVFWIFLFPAIFGSLMLGAGYGVDKVCDNIDGWTQKEDK